MKWLEIWAMLEVIGIALGVILFVIIFIVCLISDIKNNKH